VQLNQCCSPIPCLFFCYGLILPVLSWFCLLLFSVCRISWRIFCSGGLVVIYCFRFCLLWKTFIASPFLNDSFAGWSIRELKLCLFSFPKTSFHPLFDFKISVEKSAVIFTGLPLYIIYCFSLL
jgi:hypothetical protein